MEKNKQYKIPVSYGSIKKKKKKGIPFVKKDR